jgi:hypothetical protein
MRDSSRSSWIRTGLLVTVALLLLATAYPRSRPHGAQHFQTEAEAQKHCPGDRVVWVNTKTGVYHFKGQRWYGRTRQGAYECQKEADAEGDRLTHNGQ